MRRTAIVIFVALAAACWAAPAFALHDGELALAPQAGMTFYAGAPRAFAGIGLAYGLSIAYAVNDWLSVEALALYGDHTQRNTAATGQVRFSDLSGGLGPRFNWNTKYVVPYISVLASASFLQYKANWDNGKYAHSVNDKAHALGGLGVIGIDFPLHDDFTIGLSGIAGALDGTLVYSNKSLANQNVGVYGYLGAVIRLTIIF